MADMWYRMYLRFEVGVLRRCGLLLGRVSGKLWREDGRSRGGGLYDRDLELSGELTRALKSRGAFNHHKHPEAHRMLDNNDDGFKNSEHASR